MTMNASAIFSFHGSRSVLGIGLCSAAGGLRTLRHLLPLTNHNVVSPLLSSPRIGLTSQQDKKK